MNIRKIIFCTFLFTLCLLSCKKDKENYDAIRLNSFIGALDFELPIFVKVGDEITLTPKGISRADKKGFDVAWRVANVHKDFHTVRTEDDAPSKTGLITFTVPNIKGVLSVSCQVTAKGFYAETKTKELVVLDPNTSLDRGVLGENIKTFIDSRDSREYHYTKIGNRYWMIDNLSYGAKGISYRKSPVMDPIYGRYYSWEEAKDISPQSWRLPTKEDWDDLVNSIVDKSQISGSMMVNAQLNEARMWEFWPKVKITNASSFYAIPTGYITKIEEGGGLRYSDIWQYSVYWTADEVDEGRAVARYIYTKNPNLLTFEADKNLFYASVRCVKDIDDE